MRLRPQTYAFTTITAQRRRIFQRSANAELLITTLLRHRGLGRFLLHGFVVMPDHVHIMLTPVESIEKAAQFIKGGFSFAVRAIHTGNVWQAGYHAHRILDRKDYDNQLGYIANNPIRKLYEEYPWVHTTGTWALDPVPQHLTNS